MLVCSGSACAGAVCTSATTTDATTKSAIRVTFAPEPASLPELSTVCARATSAIPSREAGGNYSCRSRVKDSCIVDPGGSTGFSAPCRNNLPIRRQIGSSANSSPTHDGILSAPKKSMS
jgi:hypothetical protein